MSEKALTLAPALTPARTQPPTVIEMIDRIVGPGGRHMTAEDATALATLVKLRNDDEDRNAKKDFQSAFLALQKRLEHFQALKEVRTKTGDLKYRTMDFEEIDEQIRPIALEHGFTYSFTEAPAIAGKVGKTCIIAGYGHEKANSFYIKDTGQLPRSEPGDPKNDLTIHGYAKRGALCDGFNIVLKRTEDDAKMEGHPISPEEAAELKRLVESTGTVEVSFLKFAAAKDYDSIMSNRYDELHEYLSKRERVQKQKAGQ